MKLHIGEVLVVAALTMPAAHAQTLLARSSAPTAPRSALPPPAIDDPGQVPQSVPLPDTGIRPSLAPAARQQRDGNGDSTNVSVRRDAGGDTIEEYRRNGRVYMVRITPVHGITQTYHYDTDANLMRDPKLGPVSPVYYDIYQWGKPDKQLGGDQAQPAHPSSSG